MLWEASHAQHQNQPPQHTRPAPVCIPPKPLYGWCNFLHLALTHLENKDSYVRMLLIDFSSAFNTIIPQQLINKLNLLGLNNSLCNWILDLTGRPVSPCRPQHLEHYHTEHRCPTGLCAQPAALHASDPRLHCQVQLQPNHQVFRWHISGRPHQQQRWNTLQRGIGTAG